MKSTLGFRCDYCGRFISYADLDAGRAVHSMATPDSEVSSETWETFHLRCLPANRPLLPERAAESA